MSQALRFTFNDHDYFIQFTYKKDQEAWDKSIAKNSRWTSKMLKKINKVLDNMGIQYELTAKDLESPKPLTQNNLTVCEILRGPVGCSTKDMVCWFKGTTHRAIMDNFCKATARRHSLEGALWDMKAFETLGEEQGIKGGRSHEDNVAFRSLVNKFRFAAWNTYNNRKNHEVAKV